MVVVAGSAPAIVVMNVREKAMMTPMRMTKSSTRMNRPREVFSVMAARSATRLHGASLRTQGVVEVAALAHHAHQGEGRHEAYGLELRPRHDVQDGLSGHGDGRTGGSPESVKKPLSSSSTLAKDTRVPVSGLHNEPAIKEIPERAAGRPCVR